MPGPVALLRPAGPPAGGGTALGGGQGILALLRETPSLPRVPLVILSSGPRRPEWLPTATAEPDLALDGPLVPTCLSETIRRLAPVGCPGDGGQVLVRWRIDGRSTPY